MLTWSLKGGVLRGKLDKNNCDSFPTCASPGLAFIIPLTGEKNLLKTMIVTINRAFQSNLVDILEQGLFSL